MKKIVLMSIASLLMVSCQQDKAQSQSQPEGQSKTAVTKPAASTPSVPPAQAVVPQNTPPPPAGTPSSAPQVLATINGVNVTDDEVTARVKDRLAKLDNQIYEIKKSGLDDIVEEKLLQAEADRLKVSVDELIKTEIQSKIESPSDEEVQSFYNSYKKKLNDRPLESVKTEIVNQIRNTKQAKAYNGYIASLRQSAKVEMFMKRPRVAVSAKGAPSKGNPNAPIQIIEFSEFQCPFCKKTRPTIEQILTTYKDKVHYSFRDFPLSFHKLARKAAVAAHCAGAQGKYWEYNDMLFENQRELGLESLKKYAKDLGLDSNKFEACLVSDTYEDMIDESMADAAKAGVTGTPAYFINGIFISGAQPFEKFQEIIDEELAGL